MWLTIWIIFVIAICIFALVAAAGVFKTNCSMDEVEGKSNSVLEN